MIDFDTLDLDDLEENSKGPYAFIDAEFECFEEFTALLSVGIVIYSKNGKKLNSFYSLVKQDRFIRVTKRIQEMTGITTEQIKNATKDFGEISQVISNLIAKYEIKSIYTWGDADKRVFEKVRSVYKKTHSSPKKVFSYISRIEDISPAISNVIIGKNKTATIRNVSLSNLCYIYNVINESEHNALADADALAKCYFAFQDKDKEKYKSRFLEVRSYYADMGVYLFYRLNKQSVRPQKKVQIELPCDVLAQYYVDPILRAYIDNGISYGYIKPFSDSWDNNFPKFTEYKKQML